MKQLVTVLCLAAFISLAGAQDKKTPEKEPAAANAQATQNCCGDKCQSAGGKMENCPMHSKNHAGMKSQKKAEGTAKTEAPAKAPETKSTK